MKLHGHPHCCAIVPDDASDELVLLISVLLQVQSHLAQCRDNEPLSMSDEELKYLYVDAALDRYQNQEMPKEVAAEIIARSKSPNAKTACVLDRDDATPAN